MTDKEKEFHKSIKPSWTSDGILVYGSGSDAPLVKGGILVNVTEPVESDGQDIQFARFNIVNHKVRTFFSLESSYILILNRRLHQLCACNER